MNIKKNLNLSLDIQFEISFTNLKNKNIYINKSNSERLFKNIFSEEDLKNIWKAKKLVCAEYTKVLVDAYLEGSIDENILSICIKVILENSQLRLSEILTERLVGKKRKDIMEKIDDKIQVVFRSEDYEALEYMLFIGDKSIKEFLQDNSENVQRIKNLFRE